MTPTGLLNEDGMAQEAAHRQKERDAWAKHEQSRRHLAHAESLLEVAKQELFALCKDSPYFDIRQQYAKLEKLALLCDTLKGQPLPGQV